MCVRARARRQDEAFGGEDLLADAERLRRDESRLAEEDVDAVGPAIGDNRVVERVDPTEHPVSDGGPVGADPGGVDPEAPGAPDRFGDVRGVHEHLRGDTPAVEAGPAEAVRLYDRDPPVGEVVGDEHVAAARPDDDQVVMVGDVSVLGRLFVLDSAVVQVNHQSNSSSAPLRSGSRRLGTEQDPQENPAHGAVDKVARPVLAEGLGIVGPDRLVEAGRGKDHVVGEEDHCPEHRTEPRPGPGGGAGDDPERRCSRGPRSPVHDVVDPVGGTVGKRAGEQRLEDTLTNLRRWRRTVPTGHR